MPELGNGARHQEKALQQNTTVGQERSLSCICKVERYFFVEQMVHAESISVFPIGNDFGLQRGEMELSRTCDARLDLQNLPLLGRVLRDKARILGPGTNQCDVTCQEIEKLGQFV